MQGSGGEKPPRVKYGPILYSAVGEGVLGNWNPGITGLAMRGRERERGRESDSEYKVRVHGSEGSWRKERREEETSPRTRLPGSASHDEEK